MDYVESALRVSLSQMGKRINQINHDDGWEVVHPSEWTGNKYKIPAILALIHSEVSEALEDYRKNDVEHFKEELADIFIRLLDLSSGLSIDLAQAVIDKCEKNKSRGYKHGGKTV